MKFELIDVALWERADHFNYYMNEAPCNYNITVNLDISVFLNDIKEKNIKFYPAIIYLLSVIVNQHKAFRTSINEKREVGIFDVINPLYTVFNKNNETFSGIWTEFNRDFSIFYKNYIEDIKRYNPAKGLFAKPDLPVNLFNISGLPWISFSGFNLNFSKGHTHLLPIFTIGKYFEDNKKTLLPLSIQVHHAVCDGFHVANFIHDLQKAINEFHYETFEQ
jgi:chloramphenicol O-acetyltransferase type A